MSQSGDERIHRAEICRRHIRCFYQLPGLQPRVGESIRVRICWTRRVVWKHLRITEALTDGKWKRCEIVVSGMPKPGQRIAKIDFEFAPGCQSERICSHDVEAVGGISGFVEKPFGPAFDCKRARSETEKTICLDWNLSELDFQLAILWSRWDIEALNPEQSAQVQWRRSRDACGANNVCIRSEYEKRMTALCAKRGGRIDKEFGCSK